MTAMPDGLPGRVAEWQLVHGLLDRAALGRPEVVLFEGGQGMGRSRLLREAVGAALGRGFVVLRTVQGKAELEIAGEAMPTAAVPGCRFAMPRLEEWLGELGPGQQVLVVLDDADGLPRDVVDVLAGFVTRGRPAAWLLAVGESGRSAEIAAAFDTSSTPLVPWTSAVVAQVVEDLLGGPPGRDLTDLLAHADGVPSLVVELIEGLREEGRLRTVDGEICLTSTGLPRRVCELTQLRLAELSPKSWQVLRVAAAVGRQFGLTEISELMGESTAGILQELDEIMSCGVLTSDGRELAFRHTLTWRVVAESIPQLVRRALQQDIERLRRTRTRHGQIVVPEQPHPPVRAAHAVLAVGALAASGRFTEAIELANSTLAQRIHPTSAAELGGLLAHLLLWRGDAADANAVAEGVLATGGVPSSVTEAATAARLMALSLGEDLRAQHEAELVLASRTTDSATTDVVVATGILGDSKWAAGNLVEGLRLARDAFAASVEHPWWGTWQRLGLVSKLGQLGRLDEAEDLLRGANADADQWGLAASTGRREIEWARVLARVGRLTEATGAVRAGLVAARQASSPLMVQHGLAVLAKAALHQGNLPAAVAHIRHGRAVATEAAVLRSVTLDWVDLRLVAETHGSRAAMHALETRLAGLVTSSALFVEEGAAAAWLIGLAHAVGNRELSRTALDMVDCLTKDNPCLDAVGTAAAHARGVHERDPDLIALAVRRHLDPWAVGQARADLDALSAPVTGIPVQHQRVEHEWQCLTDTQRSIARLAGEGMTNQQIANRVLLSPHTVNYHLRGTYRKLGISSRVELARFV